MSPSTNGNYPPVLLAPWGVQLPPDPLRVTSSSHVTYDITVFDSETVLSTMVTSLLPLPLGASIGVLQGYVGNNG